MDMLDTKDQLSADKPRQLLLKILVLIQLLREVTILTQLHDHVQVVRRLKAKHQLQNIRVVHLSHDLGLCHCVPDLIVVDKSLLLHGLHGVHLSTVDFLHFEDLSE